MIWFFKLLFHQVREKVKMRISWNANTILAYTRCVSSGEATRRPDVVSYYNILKIASEETGVICFYRFDFSPLRKEVKFASEETG